MKVLLSLSLLLLCWSAEAQENCMGKRIHFPRFIKINELATQELAEDIASQLSSLYDKTKDYPYIVMKKVDYYDARVDILEFTDPQASYYKIWVNYITEMRFSRFALNSFMVLNYKSNTKNELLDEIPIVIYEYDYDLYRLSGHKQAREDKDIFLPLPKDNQFVYVCFYNEGNERKYKVINYYQYAQEKN